MQDQSTHSSHGMGATVAVVVAIVALGVGFGAAKAADRHKVNPTTMVATSDTKAADLRATLVKYGAEHMQLTDQAIDSALDGNADAAQVKAQLIANGGDISAAVGSIYGADAQTAFQKLWNIHLGDFVNYAVAGSKGDEAGKAAALADIDANYTKPIAQLLSGANPNLPESVVETAFRDHVTMTAGVIDDHINKDYAKEQTDLVAANNHIQELMSTLAGAIVKQYPAKF
jgi:hypothetical protein